MSRTPSTRQVLAVSTDRRYSRMLLSSFLSSPHDLDPVALPLAAAQLPERRGVRGDEFDDDAFERADIFETPYLHPFRGRVEHVPPAGFLPGAGRWSLGG